MMMLLLLLVALSLCPVGEAQVVELTDSNFAQNVRGNQKWFVAFTAPWCGWCKRLAPSWEELGEKATKAKIGKVDATANPEIARQLGVNGYPTLLLFAGDRIYPYASGSRDVASLLEFIDNYASAQSKPNPLHGATIDSTGNAAESDDERLASIISSRVVDPKEVTAPQLTEANIWERLREGRSLVQFGTKWCGFCKSVAPTIKKLNDLTVRSYFVYTVDCENQAALCQKFEVQSFPTIFMVSEGAKYLYKGDRSFESLKSFAEGDFLKGDGVAIPIPEKDASLVTSRRGQLPLLDASNFHEATVQDIWFIGFTSAATNADESNAIVKAMEAFQSKYGSAVHAALVDCDHSVRLCQDLKLSRLPQAVLYYGARGFLYSGEHSESSYLQFVGDGFKMARPANRPHLASLRRFSWDTYYSPDAIADFVHQYRHLVFLCFVVGVLIYGLFLGAAISETPTQVLLKAKEAARLNQLRTEKKQQQAAQAEKKKK